VGRHHPDPGVAEPGGEYPGRPLDRLPPLADHDQRAHQRPHHIVTKRIRHHLRDRDPGAVAMPLQPLQRPDRGGPGAFLAERGEVMFAEQADGGGIHRTEVKRPESPHGPVPLQRVGERRIVAHPVRIPPPQRGEPRVEPGRRRLRPEHPHVSRQHPAQPVNKPVRIVRPQFRRDLKMSNLPPRVNPSVRPPGNGQIGRRRQAQHPAERLAQDRFHGP
jgi:hypothetical protein